MAAVPVSSAASSLPLRVETLVKRFGQVTALEGVSLELRARRMPWSAGTERGGQEHADSQHCGPGDSGRGHRGGARQCGRFRGRRAERWDGFRRNWRFIRDSRAGRTWSRLAGTTGLGGALR